MRARLKTGNRRGQALVELALVLPVLLLLVVGLIEMARAWNLHQVITDASREACRLAVIADPTVTQGQVDTVAYDRIASSAFDPTLATISYPDGFHTGTGEVTSCQIQMPYQFGFLKPIIAFAVPGSNGRLTMTTIARMRNE